MHASRWGSVCLAAALALGETTAFAGAGREEESFADEAIGQMRQSEATVRSKLGGGRSSLDAATTSCLNEKLTRLEAVEREAQDARAALRRASLREDLDAIAEASKSMTALDARARSLKDEAERCGVPVFSDDPALAAEQVMVAGMRDTRKVAVLESRGEVRMMAGIRTRPSTHSLRALAAPAAATPAPAAPLAPTPPPSASPYTAEAAHEASMLAYSANLTLAVFQVDKCLASVEALAREVGGYLAQRGDAQVTVRVPARASTTPCSASRSSATSCTATCPPRT